MPGNNNTKRWYRDHINAGLLGLLGFMGLDNAEVEAQGWTVRTEDGREFIDCVSGFGAYNFGHRHPRIVAAVEDQLQRMPMSSKLLLNPLQAALAHELAALTPGNLTRSFISNSGTEAVEAALKLARLATGRPGIISATNAFHGKTLGSLSSTHRKQFQQPFEPLMGGFKEVPYGDASALEAAMDKETAAVMLEPVQGEGGIILPPAGYLAEVRELTASRGVLLILDEVQTGMGRTGRNFACEREGVCPDIMVLAKSLGGGVMPIGATVGTAEVWRRFEDDPLVHTSTFGGNALACAAALAAIRVLIEDRIAERAEKTGARLLGRLKELASAYPDLIAGVRGAGLMIGVEMTSRDISELFIANVLSRQVLIAFALNQPGVIRVQPPLIIDDETVDEVLRRLQSALDATREIVGKYGIATDEGATT